MTLIWAVALKELRQIRRDRRTMLVVLFLPAFFLFLYGYALNFDIRNVQLAVQDRDQSAASRTLIATFVRSTYFQQVASVIDEREMSDLMDHDRIRALLVIPEGFSRRLDRGEPAEIQVVLNGDNANTATTVLGYTDAVLAQAAVTLGQHPAAVLVSAAPRIWYNPELRSTLFLVPGLIAYISMITAVVSTALSIVREKERGTMEQVRMAPIPTGAFIVGKTVPYLILSQLSAMAVIVAAMVFFDLPMRGNWFALSGVVALFLVGALGTGILVSTISDTQQVAFQMAVLIAFLPTFILSGFIFPIASMPAPLQYITAARSGPVLSGRPARDCPEGPRCDHPLAADRGADRLRDGDARPVGRAAGPPMSRIRALVLKEFLELRQTPRLIGLIIVAPILQLTLLGYAATTDVHHVPIVVVDGDHSDRSRELTGRFSASPYFKIMAVEADPRAVDRDLATGRAWLADRDPAWLPDRDRAGQRSQPTAGADPGRWH